MILSSLHFFRDRPHPQPSLRKHISSTKQDLACALVFFYISELSPEFLGQDVFLQGVALAQGPLVGQLKITQMPADLDPTSCNSGRILSLYPCAARQLRARPVGPLAPGPSLPLWRLAELAAAVYDGRRVPGFRCAARRGFAVHCLQQPTGSPLKGRQNRDCLNYLTCRNEGFDGNRTLRSNHFVSCAQVHCLCPIVQHQRFGPLFPLLLLLFFCTLFEKVGKFAHSSTPKHSFRSYPAPAYVLPDAAYTSAFRFRSVSALQRSPYHQTGWSASPEGEDSRDVRLQSLRLRRQKLQQWVAN